MPAATTKEAMKGMEIFGFDFMDPEPLKEVVLVYNDIPEPEEGADFDRYVPCGF